MAVLTRGEGFFYIPILCGIFLAQRLRLEQKNWAQCLLAAVVFMLSLIGTLAPWYVRNRIIIGRGAGLSTTGEVNFYYAHNPEHYGWRTLADTPLEGLDEVKRHELGYRLSLEHIKTQPGSTWKSIWLGTYKLCQPAYYSLYWSTRSSSVKREDGSYPQKPIGVRWMLSRILRIWHYGLIMLVCLALLMVRSWSGKAIFIIFGFAFLNWLCYAVLFWGKARYRFTTEVLACVMAGVALARLLERESLAPNSVELPR